MCTMIVKIVLVTPSLGKIVSFPLIMCQSFRSWIYFKNFHYIVTFKHLVIVNVKFFSCCANETIWVASSYIYKHYIITLLHCPFWTSFKEAITQLQMAIKHQFQSFCFYCYFISHPFSFTYLILIWTFCIIKRTKASTS